ncbi:MAG: polyphosphate kinase 2 [Chloroflexota bacterium]
MAKKDKKSKKHGDPEPAESTSGVPEKPMSRQEAADELERLEEELVKLQWWVKQQGLKVVVIFEGRDTAGKGGVIKRITDRLSPRIVRTVALAAPTEREKSQYYLQRYIVHLPAAGEIVLFDRSWYNRLGVERVMGFCTEEEYNDFLRVCPVFERTLVDSGIILIKYWLDITQETQEKRFQERRDDVRKSWKLSPMDLESRDCWDEYTRARDIMFEYTSTESAPWYVVDANKQRYARLNCIAHLLGQFDYEDVRIETMKLPKQKKGKDASIPDLPNVKRVPQVYPKSAA